VEACFVAAIEGGETARIVASAGALFSVLALIDMVNAGRGVARIHAAQTNAAFPPDAEIQSAPRRNLMARTQLRVI